MSEFNLGKASLPELIKHVYEDRGRKIPDDLRRKMDIVNDLGTEIMIRVMDDYIYLKPLK